MNTHTSQHDGTRRPGTLLTCLVFVTLMVSACGIFDGVSKSLDDVISTIESAQKTIEKVSGDWRDELDQLSTDLARLESEVASDVQDVVTNATNQVGALVEDAVAMTDQAVESRIEQAGTEARCTFNFLKRSVTDELRYLVEDLKFWKKTGGHRAPPAHGTCWIDPSAVSMYTTKDGPWVADTVNMEGRQPVINIFGYNFRSDSMPVVDLVNTDGTVFQPAIIRPVYRTNYLISLDLSAGLATMPADMTLVLTWPDDPHHADASTISLLRTSEAKLELSNPVVTPRNPTATKDPVILEVTVTNTGGRPSGVGGFDVSWMPEPSAVDPPRVHHPALPAGASDTIRFPAYTFQSYGDLFSNVFIQGGASALYQVTVAPPPHVPAAERDYEGYPRSDGRVGKPGGSLGGFGTDVLYGGPCQAGYVKSLAWLDVTQVTKWDEEPQATATLVWANDDPYDCTVRVHYSINTAGLFQSLNSIDVVIFIKERGI
jgi:hypothetical protein